MRAITKLHFFSLILVSILILNCLAPVGGFLSQHSVFSVHECKSKGLYASDSHSIKNHLRVFRNTKTIKRKEWLKNISNENKESSLKNSKLNRKNHLQKFLTTCGIVSTGLTSLSMTSVPKQVVAVEDEQNVTESKNGENSITESIYDFDVQYNKEVFPLERYKGTKAAIVTSIKLDDPFMLQNMPGLMDAYNKYGKDGLKVFLFPTEQGVYEGDVDKDIRIKMYQQYQFGQFPNAVIFDRLNVVGKTADPLYRYLSRTCKNGNGVGRITLNFEKFLINSDGVPVRRYPRRYPVEAMQEDIEAVLNDRPLPPAPLAWYKAWKDAVYEADRGEYSFRRGLNYY